jgi:hypothetical protein
MRKLLLKKDPLMTAPPFLNVNNCEKGDIGMMSANNRFIPYVKLFQILDDTRALMKCSFDANADDDEWSGPFLWVAEQGSAWSTGQIKEGKIFALGIIAFKKIDDYVYRNQLGGLRKVPAVEVLPSDVWASLVRKYKTTPGSKKPRTPSPGKAKPAGTKKMAADAAKSEYWLKRSELIRGPFSLEKIQQFFTNKNLQNGDEFGSSKEGPWQTITKETLKKAEADLTQPLKPGSLDQGLLAYYRFDGASSQNSVSKESKSVWIVGGQQAVFDRFGNATGATTCGEGNGYLSLFRERSEKLALRNFTISTWFKWKNNHPKHEYRVLLSRGSAAYQYHTNYQLHIFNLSKTDSSGRLGASVGGGEDKDNFFLSSTVVADGKWHHAALVVNEKLSSGALYIDGLKEHEKEVKDVWLKNKYGTTVGVWRPNAKGVGYGHFNGILDDLRIYNRPLADVEVKQLYEYESKPPADNQ